MSFEHYQYKSGILGQGCYLTGFATKPGLLRCRLPVLLALSLTDIGRWQLIEIKDKIYRTPEMQAASWRVEQLLDTIEEERQRLGPGEDHTSGLMPLNPLAEFYWRADSQALENAVLRLQAFPDDLFKKRLARVLENLVNGQQQQNNQANPVL